MIRCSGGLGVWVLMLLVLAGRVPVLQAVEINDLYQAQVMVIDKGKKSRTQAFSQALSLVVIKLTGKADAPTMKGMRAAIESPDAFVSRYDYYQQSTGASRDHQQAGFSMGVTFDRVALNKLLNHNQLPLWGKNRPDTLVWIASEMNSERQMLEEGDLSGVVQALKTASGQRGVPLLYPLLDMEDSLSLPLAELWGLFPAPIVKASRRYATEPILAMRIYSLASGNVSARIMFIFRGEVFYENISDINVDVLAGLSLSLVAHRLAAFYSVLSNASSEHTLRLQVNAVDDVHDYADLLRHIESLTAIRTVMPVSVKGDSLVLDLVIEGSQEQVEAEITLNRHLSRVYPALSVVSEDAVASESLRRPDLYYFWQK
ncbi:MAG: DUF2066 domain-containing protein [Endozoicomonadaceae bacterium]|nr:DUF2066 domain-containing protein [Endozoicomonadaceae bacterium]